MGIKTNTEYLSRLSFDRSTHFQYHSSSSCSVVGTIQISLELGFYILRFILYVCIKEQQGSWLQRLTQVLPKSVLPNHRPQCSTLLCSTLLCSRKHAQVKPCGTTKEFLGHTETSRLSWLSELCSARRVEVVQGAAGEGGTFSHLYVCVWEHVQNYQQRNSAESHKGCVCVCVKERYIVGYLCGQQEPRHSSPHSNSTLDLHAFHTAHSAWAARKLCKCTQDSRTCLVEMCVHY